MKPFTKECHEGSTKCESIGSVPYSNCRKYCPKWKTLLVKPAVPPDSESVISFGNCYKQTATTSTVVKESAMSSVVLMTGPTAH